MLFMTFNHCWYKSKMLRELSLWHSPGFLTEVNTPSQYWGQWPSQRYGLAFGSDGKRKVSDIFLRSARFLRVSWSLGAIWCPESASKLSKKTCEILSDAYDKQEDHEWIVWPGHRTWHTIESFDSSYSLKEETPSRSWLRKSSVRYKVKTTGCGIMTTAC